MDTIAKIDSASEKLHKRYKSKLSVNSELDRTLVSFQANKTEPVFRWYKYKEGFSSALVRYVFKKTRITSGKVLDPFAGVGTTLFTASSLGLKSVGIELLPIGVEVMKVRQDLHSGNNKQVSEVIKEWIETKPWTSVENPRPIPILRITEGAYPPESEVSLSQYLTKVERIRTKAVKDVLKFAALCVLERTSFTRKDGQYLRWDYRSGRRQGKKKFDKGKIIPFEKAILEVLNDIYGDLNGFSIEEDLFSSAPSPRLGKIKIVKGSVLRELPKIAGASFDGIMTSPPYCNRYDYTRSYALELALLGVDEEQLKDLRQTMLSCTVENRTKSNLSQFSSPKVYSGAESAFEKHEVLQLILEYLEEQKEQNLLNNNGIPRMVRNYFRELCLVIFECARVLKKGAPFVMVNDNVRYAGVDIPVDLILSDFAESAGLEVEVIWVLPTGKGNSSQQMGKHGRTELRKCVYLWRKS